MAYYHADSPLPKEQGGGGTLCALKCSNHVLVSLLSLRINESVNRKTDYRKNCYNEIINFIWSRMAYSVINL